MLVVGDKAPEITAHNQKGKEIKLSDYLGKKIILYFYPKDDTPTCTVQSCNLRDNYTALKAAGYQVLGVSADDVKSHAKFAKKFKLPFPLFADVAHKAVNDYGVWGEKTNFGHTYMGIIRTTFVIDEKGYIAHIINKVDSDGHTAQILGLK
ncbi:MAG: thioredoxin-dependent thiol peroxidase [Cytophagales bacterium]|nr:thioredoxin-dependent thiol peroxidase [Cytophagales bacterium]